jgi:integrase
MASMKRHKTKYPGVYYILNKGGEKIYYIRYRKNGKSVDEKAGHQYKDDMTPARASGIRSDRSHGRTLSNAEKRQEGAQKAADWTIGSLWDEYLPTLRNPKTDRSLWNHYLEKSFSRKKPRDIIKLETDRVRISLLKKKSPQTVKHILALLRRIINYGVKQGYIAPLSFKIEMPRVNNVKTEDLTSEELQRLLKALEESPHRTAANIMKIALYSGMRRGEIYKLKWDDIDHHRGFITIRDPKGGKNQKIPLNSNTRAVINDIPENGSEFLFPSKRSKTGHINNILKPINAIKKEAGLPEDFRPMHGLRHLYATMLANSGVVDMFTLQKLLTHKSPEMTQRYAHMRDEALRKASDTVDDIFEALA